MTRGAKWGMGSDAGDRRAMLPAPSVSVWAGRPRSVIGLVGEEHFHGKEGVDDQKRAEENRSIDDEGF